MSEYPTESELDELKKLAENTRDPAGFEKFHNYLKTLWHWEGLVIRTEDKLELHTGGWSGNEDIIEVLNKTSFWIINWKYSVRGGHFYFDLTRTLAETDQGLAG